MEMETKIRRGLQFIRVKASPIFPAVEKVIQYGQIVYMTWAILGRKIRQEPYQHNAGCEQKKITHYITSD